MFLDSAQLAALVHFVFDNCPESGLIPRIRHLRMITGLSLKDAKDLIEACPPKGDPVQIAAGNIITRLKNEHENF